MASGGILRRIGVALGVDVDDKEAMAGIESLKAFAVKTLGTITVGISIAKINSLANEFGAVNKIIKGATRELMDQTGAQNKILEAANLTKSSYADTAKVVSALVQENVELFGNIDEAIKFNNAATELFKNAGKTDEQIAGLMESINKSFAKGVVDSETIGQMLEQSPEAVELLEKKLGTTKDKLEQLTSDGQISLKDLKEAFTDSAEEIEKRFLESGISIDDAMKNIRNQWGLYIAQVWDGAGVSQHVGKLMVRAFNDFMSVLRKAQPTITRALTSAMNWMDKISDGITRTGSFLGRLVEHIGGVENALKIVAIAAAAIWLAFRAEEIIRFLMSMPALLAKAFSPGSLKAAALVAAITLIVLAVEDFINFVQGNESVIGRCLESWGIDADAARESVIDFFQSAREAMKNALKVISDSLDDVRKTVAEFFQSEEGHAIFQQMWENAGEVVQAAGKMIGAAVRLISVVIRTAFQTMEVFWDRWGSTILSTVSVAVEGVMTFLTGLAQFIGGICDLITAIINGDWSAEWQAVIDIANGALTAIVGLAEAWLGLMLSKITAILGLVLSLFQIIFGNINSAVSEKIGKISEIIKSGLQAGINYLRGLPSQALTWGRDFIDGFVRGLEEKTQAVVDSIKGLGEKVRSFLHFSRPDTGPLRDYETWMPDFMSGLSAGIDSNSGTVIRKVKSMASSIKDEIKSMVSGASIAENTDYSPFEAIRKLPEVYNALKPKLSSLVSDVSLALNIKPSLRTARNAVGVNKAGNTVNQNIEINNTVKTEDKKAGREAAKQLDKSSEDVTKQIAKGLAYGRP